MRYKIAAAEYEKLSEELKSEYKKAGDGYVLEVEGLDTKAAEKFESERSRRRAAEKERDEAKTRAEELEDKFSDTAKALADADKKVEVANKKAADLEGVHTNYVRATLLDKEADTIAGELSKSPKLLLPYIKERLDVDLTDPAAPKLVYKDKDGKPGAKRDDVLKETRDNKDFAAIIVASQASGGGASRHLDTGGSGSAKPKGQFSNQRPGGTPAGEDVNLADRAALPTLVERVNARRVASGQEAL